MVHQGVQEFYGNVSDEHGEEFVLIANQVNHPEPQKEWPKCNAENAPNWPLLIRID
jgi:hypothetical protein